MKQNMGVADRIIRLLAAIILIELAVSHTIFSFGNVATWIIALTLLLTAAIGFCPIYAIFGIRTTTKKKLN